MSKEDIYPSDPSGEPEKALSTTHRTLQDFPYDASLELQLDSLFQLRMQAESAERELLDNAAIAALEFGGKYDVTPQFYVRVAQICFGLTIEKFMADAVTWMKAQPASSKLPVNMQAMDETLASLNKARNDATSANNVFNGGLMHVICQVMLSPTPGHLKSLCGAVPREHPYYRSVMAMYHRYVPAQVNL